MSAAKVIGGIALGMVAIVALVGYLLVSNLDGFIKDAIEEVGSKVTQANVSLDSVHIDLKTGRGELKGLTIANPRGYNSDYAFKLNSVVVGISPASLGGPVIVITEVKIAGARIIAEQKGAQTNLSELLDNIENYASNRGEKKEEGETETSSEDVRLMMEKFVFVNTQATIISEAKGETSVMMPDVRRKNIGDKKTGLTPEQLAEEVLGSVVEGLEKAVGEYLGDVAAAAIEKKLTEKMDAEDKSKLDALKSLFKKD